MLAPARKVSGSVMLVFTYTLNPLRLLDLAALRRARDMRLTALIDQRLRTDLEALGEAFEGFFDRVYYCGVRYLNHCFAEEFDEAAADAVAREIRLCDQLQLLSFFEGDLDATARLRDRFGLDGMSASATRRFRNKLDTKLALSNHGLSVPKALELDWSLDSKTLFARCASELGRPFLVKPVALGGSLGVTLVSTRQQLDACRRQRFPTAYFAEEEIAGELLHLDAVVVSGRPVWFGCSRYNLPTLAFSRGKPVGSMPLLPDHPHYGVLRDYTAACVRALQVDESLLHIEVIRRGDHLFAIEAAARASGGLVAMVYHRMFGYNMIQAHVATRVGVQYRPDVPDGSAYFWLMLPETARTQDVTRDYLRGRSISVEVLPSTAGSRVRGSLVGRHDTLLAAHADYRHLFDAFTAVA